MSRRNFGLRQRQLERINYAAGAIVGAIVGGLMWLAFVVAIMFMIGVW